MPQSFSAVRVHLVFSTKHRQPVFRDVALRENLFAHLGEVSNRFGCPIIRVGGVVDHVHLLGNLGRTVTIADWVKELKRVSNSWIREHLPQQGQFEWQSGYGAFSVSQSQLENVIQYIIGQVEHHREVSSHSPGLPASRETLGTVADLPVSTPTG